MAVIRALTGSTARCSQACSQDWAVACVACCTSLPHTMGCSLCVHGLQHGGDCQPCMLQATACTAGLHLKRAVHVAGVAQVLQPCAILGQACDVLLILREVFQED